MAAASAACLAMLGARCPYRSTVVVIDSCPRWRDTAAIGVPPASINDAAVCRRSCTRGFFASRGWRHVPVSLSWTTADRAASIAGSHTRRANR